MMVAQKMSDMTLPSVERLEPHEGLTIDTVK